MILSYDKPITNISLIHAIYANFTWVLSHTLKFKYWKEYLRIIDGSLWIFGKISFFYDWSSVFHINIRKSSFLSLFLFPADFVLFWMGSIGFWPSFGGLTSLSQGHQIATRTGCHRYFMVVFCKMFSIPWEWDYIYPGGFSLWTNSSRWESNAFPFPLVSCNPVDFFVFSNSPDYLSPTRGRLTLACPNHLWNNHLKKQISKIFEGWDFK